MSSIPSIRFISGSTTQQGGSAQFEVEGKKVTLYTDLMEQVLSVNGSERDVASNRGQIKALIEAIPESHPLRQGMAVAFGFAQPQAKTTGGFFA